MSCEIASGRLLDECLIGRSGIKSLYFTQAINFKSLTGIVENNGEITSLGTDPITIYQFDMQDNVGNFDEATNTSPQNGTVHLAQNITLTIFNIEPDDLADLNNLKRGRWVIWALDFEGKIRLFGRVNGLIAVGGSDVSGVAPGDKKGLDLILTGAEKDYAPFMADYTDEPFDNFANVTVYLDYHYQPPDPEDYTDTVFLKHFADAPEDQFVSRSNLEDFLEMEGKDSIGNGLGYPFYDPQYTSSFTADGKWRIRNYEDMYGLQKVSPNDCYEFGGGINFQALLADNGPVGEDLTEIYLWYTIKFRPGFDVVQGGKLFGMNAGNQEYDGLDDGFTGTMMFNTGNRLSFYMEYPDYDNGGHDAGETIILGDPHFTFTTGVEYEFCMRIVLNTVVGGVMQNDGIREFFVDNELIHSIGNMNFVRRDDLFIDVFTLKHFFGGNCDIPDECPPFGCQWACTTDEYIEIGSIAGFYFNDQYDGPRGNEVSEPGHTLVLPFSTK